MTSEVLILNKRAAIVAADSAITSSGGKGQPRYSKSATKVFDLSEGGSIAAAFFGNALLDTVPWELAIKQFRRHLGKEKFATTKEYLEALVGFLSGNQTLFPTPLLDKITEQQFDSSLLFIVKHIRGLDANIFDANRPLVDRQVLWRVAADTTRQLITADGVLPMLSVDKMDAAIADPLWKERARDQLSRVADLDAVDAPELAELAHRLRYCRTDLASSKAGLVVVGYGEDEIFPSFREVKVFGHVSDELAYEDAKHYSVTHLGAAMIQPLAQTSMIDMFTDGFGASLQAIIERASRRALEAVISDLSAQGIQIPLGVSEGILDTRHEAFMLEWRRENWAENFTPLISVISTLDVQEMAHLAETLLVLESLKERVTSPTEEVGGPIDVAAITKAEGLVWIKRKHYFDSQINMRYAARLRQVYTP
jgi:hypothetical protein